MTLFLESLGLLLAHALSWLAAGHAWLTKRDPRSALGWTMAVLFLPGVGPLLYVLFGISRAERKAILLLRRSFHGQRDSPSPAFDLENPAGGLPESSIRMEHPGRNLTGRTLLGGNAIEPLAGGDEAYPVMLEAIAMARQRVFLTTYIFNGGRSGAAFADALSAAARRKVDVRLLMDGLGQHYSLSKPWKACAAHGVRTQLFLPPTLFPPQIYINLRNHRKLLVCDDVGFTGGMNISDDNCAGAQHPVQDMHFRCKGPIVEQLARNFLHDWIFVSGETGELPPWRHEKAGQSFCRLIMDGPDNGSDRLNDLFCSVINTATATIRIMTPYFLPSHDLMASLRSAGQRNVDVRVILPAKNNLPYVHWATFRLLPSLLEAGVRVWHQPPPFAHTKLLAVDGHYSQIGSANMDARSLRLNFELNMEIFDPKFHDRLANHIDASLARSREITLKDLKAMPLPVKLRNAACWIFSPYL